jgi:hypothetical protein
MSMSDIQSQQAAEKIRIMGGGEKRSLAEIQKEQEFQEWWDKESARVQGEEKEKERKDKQVGGGRRREPRRRGPKGAGKEVKSGVEGGPNSNKEKGKGRQRGSNA